MAKKKKKDQKTLKAMVIFVLIISAVCLGISIGNGTFNISKNNENTHIIADNIEKGTDDDKGKDDNSSQVPEPETKPEPPKKEIESKTKPEEGPTEPDKEVPEGSGLDDNFDMDIDPAILSNDRHGWSFKRNKEHIKPIAYNKFDIEQYGGYYAVDTNEKVIYLTFDNGYENGYTPSILDTLKANDVQATFFVTKPYIEKNIELAKRMKEEGHIVGNHSVSHKRMHELTDEKVKEEIEETARYFEEVTGYKMDSFFRPPEGEYSERTLYLTRKLGYRTIFWSMAYADWNVNEQKGKEYAYNHVMDNYHPGMIPLLHAVSSSNTEALDDIIKSLKKEGYRFGNLYEVE